MATVVSAAWSSDLYVNILFVYYLVHPVSLGITLLLFQVEDLGTMLENMFLTITYPPFDQCAQCHWAGPYMVIRDS